jgi:hypothetical protein
MAGKVNWYGKNLLLLVDGASDEILTQAAFVVEAEAKVASPVDTGFMRNAIYAITPLANQRAQAEAEATTAAARPLAPSPQVGKHEAAVHGAAEYTIYQEMKRGFLYGALEKAARQFGGIVAGVKRL